MEILHDIKIILRQARQNVYQSLNATMVTAYWLIGKRIVEENQKGESRAEYGKGLIKALSQDLQSEFGQGFSQRNLEQMRLFFLEYSIPQTPSAELNIPLATQPNFRLSWSHYLSLISIKDVGKENSMKLRPLKTDGV
ncbi:DUF1016 N-terminal domain-containing protein [Dyadobacter arcticus]|uniref:YhcG N-terminal domain-containing protein n=1 Tax=Dyadobacter arcticus TaxID=1078754 RepID=A0ABX0UN28_9BACT|nr:DUF1016 N-terminal domain-containing protein [Dyadobacter arcticus]NIJ52850.1 hypothetical protein [Dyadobacter arcticus]